MWWQVALIHTHAKWTDLLRNDVSLYATNLSIRRGKNFYEIVPHDSIHIPCALRFDTFKSPCDQCDRQFVPCLTSTFNNFTTRGKNFYYFIYIYITVTLLHCYRWRLNLCLCSSSREEIHQRVKRDCNFIAVFITDVDKHQFVFICKYI